MFGNNISQSNKAMTASIAIIAYAIMVAIYLSPAEVQYKISFPVLSLALFSFLLLPVPMSLAMLFFAATPNMSSTHFPKAGPKNGVPTGGSAAIKSPL